MVGRYQAVAAGATDGSTPVAIAGPFDPRHTHEQHLGVWHTLLAGVR